MEDSETPPTAASPAMSTPGLTTAKNHSHHLKHHNHFHSVSRNHHNNTSISFNFSVIIILSVVSIVVVLAISLIIVMYRRIKSVGNHDSCNESGSVNNSTSSRFIAQTTINSDSSPDVKASCIYGGSAPTPPNTYKGVQVFTYKELEQATDNFSDINVIGNGRFGVVYKGVLADGTMAAIKRFHRDGKEGERAFRIEVDLLSRLNCPYLVKLLGCCTDQSHSLLVYESMANGDLQQHLHCPSNQHRPLDWRNRLIIALDCARALEFLHEHASPTVIHRDLKCSNILLDENLRAKVSGFGLAKMGSDKVNGQISTRVLGTTGYLAPEYASKGKLTTKSDVYSYGVVLLQLLTGRVPVDIKRPPGEHVLVSWALPRLTNRDKVDEMVDPAIQGQYSKKDLIQVAAIAAMCVQPEADYRPLMVDVVQSLIPIVKNSNSTSSSGFH